MRRFVLCALLFISVYGWSQRLNDCSGCAERIISKSELSGLDKEALRLLKNEIYARKGYTFSNKKLKEHFSRFDWYTPFGDNSKVVLNDIEIRNIAMMDRLIAEGGSFIPDLENSKYRYLSDEDTQAIFSDEVQDELGIRYGIYKVYSYTDVTGDYYFVMSEDSYTLAKSETGYYNDKIQGVNCKKQAGRLVKTFELNDFIKMENQECDVHFWSRYILIEDVDGDGVIEPIIVYGIMGENGYSESTVKILIYKNGVKTAVRIYNSSFDSERYIQIDKAFYSLPAAIQERVKYQMRLMEKNNHCLYPYRWEGSMANKKLMIK